MSSRTFQILRENISKKKKKSKQRESILNEIQAVDLSRSRKDDICSAYDSHIDESRIILSRFNGIRIKIDR
jgi:hypothetical protein